MISLGAGAARQSADPFQNLMTCRDRGVAFRFTTQQLEAARDANLQRIERPAHAGAFIAEGGDTGDRQVDWAELIEQKIVAFARGAADRLLAAGTEPERRMGTLLGRRLDQDIVEMPALAVMRKTSDVAPRLANHSHRLVEVPAGIGGVDTEPREFRLAIAPADTEIEPSAGQQIERRRFFRDQHRIVPAQHHDGCTEPDPARPRREIRENVQRGRDLAVYSEMVLDNEHGVEAERLGFADIVDIIGIALAVAGRTAARRAGAAEQTEFHAHATSRREAGWWARQGSNLQPDRYERPALTN